MKSKIGFFALLPVVLFSLIISCTCAGVSCDLLGKWSGESGGVTYIIEFYADDTFVYSWDNGSEKLSEVYKITGTSKEGDGCIFNGTILEIECIDGEGKGLPDGEISCILSGGYLIFSRSLVLERTC